MKRIALYILCFMALLAVGAWAGAGLVNLNPYRAVMIKGLSQIWNREIKISGDMKIKIGWRGPAVVFDRVQIANAPWSTIPLMVDAGQMMVRARWMPILRGQIAVDQFAFRNATILLERNAQGQPNWDISLNAKPSAIKNLLLDRGMGQIKIIHSQIILRDQNDHRFDLGAHDMSLSLYKNKGNFYFDGMIDKTPLTMAGGLAVQKDILVADNFKITIGGNVFQGQIGVNLGGIRPYLFGAMGAESVDIKTLPFAQDTDRVDVGFLQLLDMKMQLGIKELAWNQVAVQGMKASLELRDGELLVFPLQMISNNSQIVGQFRVDSVAAPPRFILQMKIPTVDLSDVVHLWGLGNFISGRGQGNFYLNTRGQTMHELAANSFGNLDIVAAGGTITDMAIDDIFAHLMKKLSLAETDGYSNMNCLVAHIDIASGVGNIKNMFVDTNFGTMSGTGYINIVDGGLDVSMRGQQKQLGVSGDALPNLRVTGKLTSPQITTVEAPTQNAPVSDIYVAPGIEDLFQNMMGVLQQNGGVQNPLGQGGGHVTDRQNCINAMKSPQSQNQKPGKTGWIQREWHKYQGIVKQIADPLLHQFLPQ